MRKIGYFEKGWKRKWEVEGIWCVVGEGYLFY